MSQKPERYEDVVGPARSKWRESMAVFKSVADQATTAVTRQAERIAKADETIQKAEQQLEARAG